VGGGRVALNWVADAGVVRLPSGETPWNPVMAGPLTEAQRTMLEPEASSPLRRWRYRLLTRGLAPETNGAGSVALPRLGDPILEALARQTEGKWQAALSELWLSDPELAERVKHRLAAMVDFGSGVVAPAWATDGASLEALLMDLLNRRLDAGQKAERAAAWLEALPAGAAWVVDDAGLRDAGTGRPLSTCGVANLLDRTTLAWASTGETASPELLTVQAFSAGVAAAHGRDERSGGPTPVQVHVGRWVGTRMLALGSLPATPPGARIEGFLRDWTMAALLAGAPDDSMATPIDWEGAALLRREADGGWWLYGEFRSAGMNADTDTGSEVVRLWFGPSGRPTALIRANSAGVVVNDVGQGPVREARVSREPGKWILRVPVPPGCIESDGTLRMAIERRDARGRRTTWPRPMLPWQTEPGRVAVDMNAWGDASAAK
jgi:hypothetical protein